MIGPSLTRPLGTMVTYGFPRGHLDTDLKIAARLGATHLEVLPDWRAWPDPLALRKRLADEGFLLHSAHGCWGGQSIRADRVDLGEPDPLLQQAAVEDLRRCLDWLAEAGGRCLIVHPGGYADPARNDVRRAALGTGLLELAAHAQGSELVLCVENMPPGVHPGSRMADLADLVAELDHPRLALALDTGHAHITSTPAEETLAAGSLIVSTHVHDNNGRQDSHDPPGRGSISWAEWRRALDAVGYRGPILLECIRKLRERPELLDDALLHRLRELTEARSDTVEAS